MGWAWGGQAREGPGVGLAACSLSPSAGSGWEPAARVRVCICVGAYVYMHVCAHTRVPTCTACVRAHNAHARVAISVHAPVCARVSPCDSTYTVNICMCMRARTCVYTCSCMCARVFNPCGLPIGAWGWSGTGLFPPSLGMGSWVFTSQGSSGPGGREASPLGKEVFPSFPPFPALPSCVALGESHCLSHFLISLRWGGATLPPLLLSASFLKGPQLCSGGQRAYLNAQVLQTPCSWVPT